MSFASICERLHLSCLLDALCNVRYFSAGEVGCTENPSTLTGDGAAPEPPLLHSVRAQCVWERGGGGVFSTCGGNVEADVMPVVRCIAILQKPRPLRHYTLNCTDMWTPIANALLCTSLYQFLHCTALQRFMTPARKCCTDSVE